MRASSSSFGRAAAKIPSSISEKTQFNPLWEAPSEEKGPTRHAGLLQAASEQENQSVYGPSDAKEDHCQASALYSRQKPIYYKVVYKHLLGEATVRKVVTKFKKCERWKRDVWYKRKGGPKHEPIRVKHQVRDQLVAKPGMSKRALARALKI